MRLTVKGQRWACIAAVAAACLATGSLLPLFRGGHLPFMDGHPHRLGYAGVTKRKGATEVDFEAVFGGPGSLVRGNRTPGSAYTVEWSDDTYWLRVSFGGDGKWTREEGGLFFRGGYRSIPTPYEECKLALRRMGFDVR